MRGYSNLFLAERAIRRRERNEKFAFAIFGGSLVFLGFMLALSLVDPATSAEFLYGTLCAR